MECKKFVEKIVTDTEKSAESGNRRNGTTTIPVRRDFLYYATAGAGAVATGAAVWPLLNSMNPSADVHDRFRPRGH